MTSVQIRQGFSLYAEERGNNGPVTLLLHGLGGAGSMWAPLAALLAPHHRVLVPDLLGFGRSPWPDVQYTVEDHLAALDRLLEERDLGDSALDVAGHSMGAVLAAEFAARNPDRVDHLTLISLPYFQSEEEVREIAAGLGLLAKLTAGEHWGARTVCGVMCALRPLFILLAPRFAPGLPPAVARDALRHNFNSYSLSLQNVIVRHRLDDTMEVLANRSVLLVHGDADRVVPIDNVRPLARRFSSWRMETLPGAGHLLPIQRPEELFQLLRPTVDL